MGIFDNLKAKKYWRDHENERKQIEQEGAILLAEFNNLVFKLNVMPDVAGYVEIRERLLYILDWFIELENRKCPYQLIGGATNKRVEIIRVFNYGLNYAVKRSVHDFEIALEQLIVEADNYFECKRAINKQKETNENSFNGTGARFVTILQHHFYQDNFIAEPLIACGIPEQVVMSRDTEQIDTYKPTFTQEQKDDFNAYFLALKNRYRLEHEPLIDISSLVTNNINLQADEKLYLKIHNVSLHEEVVVSRNVSYGGIRWQYGLARGGNMSYTSNAVKNLVIQDIGTIFVTDKRIIFLGKHKRKTIAVNISSIIAYELFKDGVLLRIANRNNGVMFRFEPMQRYEGLLMLQDGMNNFMSVIERISGHTEEQTI
jgi:hypothetical protein